MPAHKGGVGAPPRGVALFGAAAYDADVSEMGGFDYLHDPGAPLVGAQARAATLFGAEATRFLVNGATVGNIAAILSTVRDGEEILVARGSHRSVYAGIALSGARPVYLPPCPNPTLDALIGIAVDDVDRTLRARPAIRAVHVTNPSYYGFTIDIAAIAERCAESGVPLLVDEAHGSHWVLNDRFPPSALSVGASIVVQSPHKTLGSLTQSSLLHTSGSLVDRSRLDGNLQMLQSSSPSALLLVSLDLAVDEMARVGRARWGTAIDLADELRMMIGCHRGLYACGKEVVGTPGVAGYDPTKVVVDVHGIETTGFAAAAWLRTHAGVNPEFSDLRRMVFSVTFADDHASITLLAEALGALAREGASASGRGALVSEWPAALPEMCLTPREAAGRPTHAVPVAEAVDRICGEMVIPYPPGIPLLVPGERISDGVVAAIEQFAGARSRIVGVADATGATLRCIAP